MDGYDLITMSLTFDIWLRRPRLTFNNKFIYLLMDLVPSAMFLDVLNFRYFSLLTPFRDEFDTPAQLRAWIQALAQLALPEGKSAFALFLAQLA